MKYFILQLFIIFLILKFINFNEITITIIGKGEQKILSDNFQPLPSEIKIEQASLNSNILYDLQNVSTMNYHYDLQYNFTSNYLYGLQDNETTITMI